MSRTRAAMGRLSNLIVAVEGDTATAAAKRIRDESLILNVNVPANPQFWAATKHADVMRSRNPEVITNTQAPVLTPEANMRDMAEAAAVPSGRPYFWTSGALAVPGISRPPGAGPAPGAAPRCPPG